jgi:CheY-like chemotaxis protein
LNSRFILVDDDADDGALFGEALNEIAPQAAYLTTENGRKLFELLTHASDFRPDLIFLDINMPIMNGWESLAALKQDVRFANIPVIMYSTSSAKRDVDKAYELGAQLFVTKPESFTELRQFLQNVVSHPPESLPTLLVGFPGVRTH